MSCEHTQIQPLADFLGSSGPYEVAVCLECGRLINNAQSGEMAPGEIVALFADLYLILADCASDAADASAGICKAAIIVQGETRGLDYHVEGR